MTGKSLSLPIRIPTNGLFIGTLLLFIIKDWEEIYKRIKGPLPKNMKRAVILKGLRERGGWVSIR